MQQTWQIFSFLSLHLTTRSFNLLLSTLPPLILRIVSALGFPSNRAVGIEQLKQCVAGRGVRYGIASLALLVYVASVCRGTLYRVASVATSCPPSLTGACITYLRWCACLCVLCVMVCAFVCDVCDSCGWTGTTLGLPGWICRCTSPRPRSCCGRAPTTPHCSCGSQAGYIA